MNDQVGGFTLLLFLYVMQLAPTRGTRAILLTAIVGCGAYLLLDNEARHEVLRNPGPLVLYALILLVAALVASRRGAPKPSPKSVAKHTQATALKAELVGYHPVGLALMATLATGVAFFVLVSLGKSLKVLNVF